MIKRQACDWFDREGAVRIERGEDPHPHLDQCPACREAHDEYLGLVELLPRAHAGSAAQARRLARRVRMAVTAALGGVACFFSRRRTALAATKAATALATAGGIALGTWSYARLAPEPVPLPEPAARRVEPVAAPISIDLPASAGLAARRPPGERALPVRPASTTQLAPEPADQDDPSAGDAVVQAMIRRGLCGGPCP